MSMSIIDSQEPAYRMEHEIDVLTKRVIAELEQEKEEVLEAWANQAKTIKEQIERIYSLEQLVRDLWDGYDCFQCKLFYDECKVKSQEQMEAVGPCRMEQRISALGIETEGGA